MSELPIDLIVFALLSISAIVFSFLVVEHKSLVYAAVCLGFLGITNAALFSMLGFTFIALFHLAVYVGAAVIFILFSVTMFKEAPTIERRIKVMALTVIPLIALSMVIVYLPYLHKPLSLHEASYRIFSELFIEKYWMPVIVTAIALVTTLIEAITLARRELEK